MSSNRFKGKRKNRNTKKKRNEKKAVLLALEDTRSSKYYFQELIKDKGLTGKVIFAKHIGTDPKNVVKAIENHLKENRKNSYEKKWVVIDKDDYSKEQINGAIQKARGQDICVAISNEAYELWILLHFKPVTAHTDRKTLNRELDRIFKDRFKCKYSKASRDIYTYIIGYQETAITNAKNLANSYIRDNGTLDPFSNNPLTLLYQLVEYLNELNTDEPQKTEACFPQKWR